MLQLNCWALGDYPSNVFSIEIGSAQPWVRLTDVIKGANEHAFSDIDAAGLRLWKVKIDLKEVIDLKTLGIEDMSTIAEKFERLVGSRRIPFRTCSRLHIIVERCHASRTWAAREPLITLQALYDVVLNKPDALLERQTVRYEMETMHEGEIKRESKSLSCNIFNIEDHVERLSSMIPVCARLMGLLGSVGKSVFILCMLLKRMQDASPVAIQHRKSSGYFLINDHGVSWYCNADGDPLDTDEDVWSLCYSNDEATSPRAFRFSQTARVIQAMSLQECHWYDRISHFGALQYSKDIWEEEELAMLPCVIEKVTKMLYLLSKWGLFPRFVDGSHPEPSIGGHHVR
ncbi:hypothetical protein AZE42_07125 [Rhizopogon vesiculosus]|uniref:Crinkler effector protein N-terminal domain-containing protein n=1 Tax=Rhizopogon vesiculosus TaxID=180088 RepID=A0A1J8PH85_9AGAM|nr:hypothetical protein AZE42_07125 [Rhizopogon vesiculosus]